MSHPVPESATQPARGLRERAKPDTLSEGLTQPRGQILIIFAFMLTILLGMAAFVVDLAWIWSNQLQVQRAADAGALAGVVHLPNDPNGGIAAARSETRKNGYTNNVNAEIVANPDPSFSRRMIVTVSAPVDTFFMGLFGFNEVTVTRTSRAEYILPVPMGSPQNYLGVGRLVKNVEGATEADDWEVPNATGDPSDWSNDGAYTVESSNNNRTSEGGNDSAAWRDFGINIPDEASIKGIEVEIEARRNGSGSCRVGVEISAQADDDDDWTSSGFTFRRPAT